VDESWFYNLKKIEYFLVEEEEEEEESLVGASLVRARLILSFLKMSKQNRIGSIFFKVVTGSFQKGI
jgi:hypothetical protein